MTKPLVAAGETPFYVSLPKALLHCQSANGKLNVLQHNLTPQLRTVLYQPINNQHHQRSAELIRLWQALKLSAMPGHPASAALNDTADCFSLILLHQAKESELHQLIPLAIGNDAGDWQEGADKFSKQLVVYSDFRLPVTLRKRVQKKMAAAAITLY